MEDQEAEPGGALICAMCPAAKEAVWLTEDLGTDLQTPLAIIRRQPLALAQNLVFHPRSKHIAIQYPLRENWSSYRQVYRRRGHAGRCAHQIATASSTRYACGDNRSL